MLPADVLMWMLAPLSADFLLGTASKDSCQNMTMTRFPNVDLHPEVCLLELAEASGSSTLRLEHDLLPAAAGSAHRKVAVASFLPLPRKHRAQGGLFAQQKTLLLESSHMLFLGLLQAPARVKNPLRRKTQE